MGGSSLPVWTIILVSGALAVFSMGCFNPFIAKKDKEKVKKISDENLTSEINPEVKIRFHFNGIVYILIASAFILATLVSFFIESFSSFKDRFFGGGFWGYFVALIIVLVVSVMAEFILMTIPVATEDRVITSIAMRYAKLYNTKVIVTGHD